MKRVATNVCDLCAVLVVSSSEVSDANACTLDLVSRTSLLSHYESVVSESVV